MYVILSSIVWDNRMFQNLLSPSFMNMYKVLSEVAHPMLGWKNCKIHVFRTWGSLYLSWYTQGFLGVSLGDLNSGRDCLRPIPTPPWVCLAHAMVVEFFKRFFWFRLRQFLGAWHLDLGFDPNFYFQDIFLLPPGLSSLVWCLHWVSLLLVWLCKNCLGRITLWNIYTVQLLSFFWIHTLGYFYLWKNVCNFSLPLCWLGFSFDLLRLLWDLYVFAPNTLDLLMGCTLASFSLNWRRLVAVLALILLNLSVSISSGVWFPIMLLFLPVSESSGTWFPFPVVFSVEGTIADWKWTPKSFWLMSLPFFIMILIAMINKPIIGRTMRLKNTIKQAGNFLSWSSGRLKGNHNIRLFTIISHHGTHRIHETHRPTGPMGIHFFFQRILQKMKLTLSSRVCCIIYWWRQVQS